MRILIASIVMACVGCSPAVYSNDASKNWNVAHGTTPLIVSYRVNDDRPLCFEEAVFGSEIGQYRCVTVGHFREWTREQDRKRNGK